MTLGERFAVALAAKDAEALRTILAPDIDFKGLTPRKFWETREFDELIDIFFGTWFSVDKKIQGIAALEVGEAVGDIQRVGYRLDVATPGGPHTVEQQAYYTEQDGRLVYLRLLCSGFRPRS